MIHKGGRLVSSLEMVPKMLLLNLAGVLGGVPKGLLLDQVTTMGQGPTVTLVDVPHFLWAFTMACGLEPSLLLPSIPPLFHVTLAT